MPLTPNNREEYWLQGMVDGQTTLEPNKRREYWYKEIVDAIGSGGGGGDFSVFKVIMNWNDDYTSCTLDKTYAEIKQAFQSNFVISIVNNEDVILSLCICADVGLINGSLTVSMLPLNALTDSIGFIASSENAYPVWSE